MSEGFDKKKIKKATIREANIISVHRSTRKKGLYILVSCVVGTITFFAIIFVAFHSLNNTSRQILTFSSNQQNTFSDFISTAFDNMIGSVLSLFWCVPFNPNDNCNDQITFSTALGDVIGNVLPIPSTSKSLFEFVGIPFCIPPIGPKRFWPCIPPKSLPNLPFDARQFGPACYQDPKHGEYNLTLSEDCLTLNIWTPVNTNADSELYPVMVFIYGGSMIGGSGDSNNLTQFLMDNSMEQNIIGVTFNYRLGVFGFLSSEMLFEEGISGVYNGKFHPTYGGLNGGNDQIEAIKWIKEHISDFGGDPERITLFGESAGGVSVCAHLISPLTPRFHVLMVMY